MLNKILATEHPKGKEEILATDIIYKNILIPKGSRVWWNSRNIIILFHPSKEITINGLTYQKDLALFLHDNGQVRRGCIAKKFKLARRKTLERGTIIYQKHTGIISQIFFPEGGRYHQKDYLPGTLLSLAPRTWNVVTVQSGTVIEDPQDPHLSQPSHPS